MGRSPEFLYGPNLLPFRGVYFDVGTSDLFVSIPPDRRAFTAIRFALPRSGHVERALYNLAGQKVVTLVDGMRPAGSYTVHWDDRDASGRDLASGVYLYQLRAGEQQVETCRLLLLR